MASGDGEASASRLLEALIGVVARQEGIEAATMAAVRVPSRSAAVLSTVRRQLAENADVDDETRAEVERLIDLLSGTGLFRR